MPSDILRFCFFEPLRRRCGNSCAARADSAALPSVMRMYRPVSVKIYHIMRRLSIAKSTVPAFYVPAVRAEKPRTVFPDVPNCFFLNNLRKTAKTAKNYLKKLAFRLCLCYHDWAFAWVGQTPLTAVSTQNTKAGGPLTVKVGA